MSTKYKLNDETTDIFAKSKLFKNKIFVKCKGFEK